MKLGASLQKWIYLNSSQHFSSTFTLEPSAWSPAATSKTWSTGESLQTTQNRSVLTISCKILLPVAGYGHQS